MTNEEILGDVSKLMIDTFDLESTTITHETTAEDIDEWDSLSHIELISNIESHFKVRFALGELQELKNIGDMVSLIASKTN